MPDGLRAMFTARGEQLHLAHADTKPGGKTLCEREASSRAGWDASIWESAYTCQRCLAVAKRMGVVPADQAQHAPKDATGG